MKTSYLVLVRHGRTEHSSPDGYVPPRDRKLTPEGRKEAAEVIARFAEVLSEFPPDLGVRVGEVWHGSAEHLIESAGMLKDFLSGSGHPAVELVHDNDLDPAHFGSFIATGRHLQVLERLRARFTEFSGAAETPDVLLRGRKNAIAIIGHQPMLGWLACELLQQPVPIDRSEILCLRSGDRGPERWTLWWSISLTDPETMKQLYDKVRSKMDVAKVLSAFIVPVVGLTLGALLDPTRMETFAKSPPNQYALYTAAGLLLISVALYLATIYAYDRLLMPVRFWADRPRKGGAGETPDWLVWRPPSSATWVLYQNMMRIWSRLFTPATGSVLLGLVALAYAVFRPRGAAWPVAGDWLFLVLAAAVSALLGLYCYLSRPRLGVED